MEKTMKKTVSAAVVLIMVLTIIMSCIAVQGEKSYAGNSANASKTKVVVKSVEYDPEDREVEFEFKHKVKYKKLKVKITDGKTKKNYAIKVYDLDSDEFNVKVSKLKYGRKYNYKITGIRRANSKKYVTVKGTFRAIDR